MRTRKLALFVASGSILAALGVLLSSFQLFFLGLILLVFCWLPWRDIFTKTHVKRASDPVYLREGDEHEIVIRMKGTTPVGSLVAMEDRVPEGALVSHGSDIVLTSRPGGHRHAPLWKRGYRLYFPHFGRFRVGPLRTRVWDPFAMFVTEGRMDASEDYVIYPTYRDLSYLPGVFTRYRHFQSNYRMHKPGIGSEFFNIREYHPGDPMKMINWKAYARKRKLLVNVNEREVSCSAILMLDARASNAVGTRRHNPMSWSISSMLSLSSYLLRTRNEVGVLTYGGDLFFIPTSASPVHFNRIQELLIDIDPEGAIPFGAALEVAMREMSPSTVLFLFSSLMNDPTLMDALSFARLKGIDITIITPPAEFFDRTLSDPALYESDEGPPGKRASRKKKKAVEEEDDEKARLNLSSDMDYRVLMMRRRNYLKDLKRMGVRVVDWRPDTPIEKLLETLT